MTQIGIDMSTTAYREWPEPSAEPFGFPTALADHVELTDVRLTAVLNCYCTAAMTDSRMYAAFYAEAQDRGLIAGVPA